MKQHIDTIPVWEAYQADCECPLCRIRLKNEAMYVDNFLGASVMEPSTRVEVNQKGFCQRHFQMMFDSGNRLGLALLCHTYLKETMAKLDKDAQAAKEAAAGEAGKSIFARVGGKKAEGVQAAIDSAREIAGKCILCERLDATMDRYVYTLIYMWKHESEFRAAFEKSKGFCLNHYAQVLAQAQKDLSGKELKQFVDMLCDLQKQNLERIEKEIEWFTLKFDYRNQSKPWGNSQDSVERTINKLRGACVGDLKIPGE